MDYLVKCLAPLQANMSERTSYYGFLVAVAAFFLALFMPWARLPVTILGVGDIYATGWDELAYLSVLPFAGLFLNGLPNRRALKLNVLGLCIMLAFALLLVDNVEHRSIWLTPLLVDADNQVPHALVGSTLGLGFWLALASMIAMSVFGMVWTMHKSSDLVFARPAVSGVAV